MLIKQKKQRKYYKI